MIEVMVETSQHTSKDVLNPDQAQTNEILPLIVEWTLVVFGKNNIVMFKVNTHKFFARIVTLKDQLLIAEFVRPKPSPQGMEAWLQTPNQRWEGSRSHFVGMSAKTISFYLVRRKMRSTMPLCYHHSSQIGEHVCYNVGYQDSILKILAIFSCPHDFHLETCLMNIMIKLMPL